VITDERGGEGGSAYERMMIVEGLENVQKDGLYCDPFHSVSKGINFIF
jgi:hypothetical protein